MVIFRSTILYWLFLLIIALNFSDKFYIADRNYSHELELGLFGIILILSFKAWRRFPKEVLALILAYVFIHAVFGMRFPVSSRSILQLLLDCKLELALIAGYGLVSRDLLFRKIPMFFSAVLFLCLLLSLFDQFSPELYVRFFPVSDMEHFVPYMDFRRSSGMFRLSGGLGIFSAITLVYYYALKKHEGLTTRTQVGLFLSIACILLSGQRMEILAVAFAILNLMALEKGFRPLKYYLLGAFIFLAYVLSDYDEAAYQLTKMFSTGEKMTRLELIEGGVRLANDNFPLGSGLGTYASSMSMSNPEAAYGQAGILSLWWRDVTGFYMDGYWAMVIGELGWFGATGVLIVYFLYFRLPMELLRSSKNADALFAARGFILTMTACLMSSLASPVFTARLMPLLMIGIYYGFCFRVKNDQKILSSD